MQSSRGTWSGRTLGLECAGEIVRVGPGVAADRVGERVQGWVADGFRTYITARAEQFISRFAGLSAEQAAAVPTVYLTAYYGLKEVARLRAGERVLIHAATGGVGLAAIQVARALGAEVFATAGSPEKRAYLHSIGVEHVMDSRTLAFADQVLEWTDRRGVDVVLNSLTGDALTKSLAVLAPGGRFIEIGKRDIDADSALRLKPFNRGLLFAAIDLDRLLVDRPEEVARMQDELREMFHQGRLGPLPISVYPAAKVAEAFRFLAQAKHIGKVVVSFDSEPVPIAPMPAEPPRIRRDGTYLITGGFSGFGLETARWLVQQGAGGIVLVGRSGAATSEAALAVAELERAGAQVKAAAVDVTEAAQVASLLGEIETTLPPLRGIFHAAMVLDDDLLDRLDAARFRAPLAPKVLGAWNLHVLTQDLPIDMFVLYSSMVAILGNLGQASYASANAFLDALALHRRTRGLPALSINWGSLGEAGFVARNPAIARHLERTGLFAIPAGRALEVMGRLLAGERARIGVAQVDWSLWGQAIPAMASRPRFAEVLAEPAAGCDGSKQAAPRAFAAALHAAGADQRIGLAAERLREIVANVFRLPPAKLELHQNLNQLGIDSLMAVELQTLIADQTGVRFSPMDFMAGPTVMTMAEQVVEKLMPGSLAAVTSDSIAGESAPPTTSRNGTSRVPVVETNEPSEQPSSAIPDVDQLSDAEVDELLARIISQETPH